MKNDLFEVFQIMGADMRKKLFKNMSPMEFEKLLISNPMILNLFIDVSLSNKIYRKTPLLVSQALTNQFFFSDVCLRYCLPQWTKDLFVRFSRKFTIQSEHFNLSFIFLKVINIWQNLKYIILNYTIFALKIEFMPGKK